MVGYMINLMKNLNQIFKLVTVCFDKIILHLALVKVNKTNIFFRILLYHDTCTNIGVSCLGISLISFIVLTKVKFCLIKFHLQKLIF